MGEMIYRIPGSCLLIFSLLGLALRTLASFDIQFTRLGFENACVF